MIETICIIAKSDAKLAVPLKHYNSPDFGTRGVSRGMLGSMSSDGAESIDVLSID